MSMIENILSELDERAIARNVGIGHDEARMSFPLRSNTIANFEAFSRTIGDYYNQHVGVMSGGTLSRAEAQGRAKELLERDYRRRGGDIVSAFNDAHDGTNGGLRVILDKLADALKAESVERHVRDVFDRHVAPNSWVSKVDIIRQFIARCGVDLSSTIDVHHPERYAQNYRELIHAYVVGLHQTSSIFRRL
jgi:hypothetical protein